MAWVDLGLACINIPEHNCSLLYIHSDTWATVVVYVCVYEQESPGETGHIPSQVHVMKTPVNTTFIQRKVGFAWTYIFLLISALSI